MGAVMRRGYGTLASYFFSPLFPGHFEMSSFSWPLAADHDKQPRHPKEQNSLNRN